MPNDDASNVNNNADEDDDRRRRAAASTRPDTHDHTLDRTPRHSLDDVTDDHNGRPGRRRTARLPAVSNHRRLLLSPLWLLIALATMLGLNASSAAAGGGLETRVRAFDHVTVDAVGQPSSERPASVGCLRPSQPGFASGSCVATEAAGSSIDDLLQPGGSLIGKAGTDETIRELTGGLSGAQAMFEQLSQGGTVVEQTSAITRVELANNGGFVQLRTVMSRSPGTVATIDVNIPGLDITKLKFNP